MTGELRYDDAHAAEVIAPVAEAAPAEACATPPAGGDGMGCHAGAAEMDAAARAAGKSEILDRYAADYPRGPHDKPQSMCPAFGSLRVGLRMRRVATVLSGSACCVYGLTFVSHFYGARRSVGYVPFNSETLVTGKLFEDIRDAVHELADPDRYDAVVVTNLCVPTASGVPLRLLPAEINGVRIVGIDVPGFGVPTHAEAKDVLAGAMLAYARAEIEAGPVAAPQGGRSDRPTVTLLGEMFPADPMMIGALLAPLGLAAGPVARALCRARLRGGGGDPSLLHRRGARVRGRGPAGDRLGAGRGRWHAWLAGRHRGRLRAARRPRGRGAERLRARDPRGAGADADQGHDHAIGL
jgi:chlorophyllide a reductase subunit Y